MSHAGPNYTMEERKGGFILVWREHDWALPRRMVASFPPHPHDRNESLILAEMLVELLNREFPNRATEAAYDPELDVPPAVIQRKLAAAPATTEQPGEPVPPAQPEPAPAEAPAATAPVQPAPAAPPAPQPMTPLQAYAATRVAQRERKAMPDVSGLKGRDKVQAMRKSLFGDDDPNAQGAQP